MNIQGAAVDGGDGHAVLAGVDAVVSGQDVDIAAIDGQVQFRIQALVLRRDVQHAGTQGAAVHIHGHLGIQGAVVLVELLGLFHRRAVIVQGHGLRLVDLGHIGAGDAVFRAVGDDDVGSRRCGVHGLTGCFRIVGTALIDPVENDGRGHGAGDVHTVQNQCHHGVRIGLCVLPQVHGHLSRREGAAEGIGAGFGDVDHRVGIGLLLAVGVRFGTSAIGEVLAVLVVYDIPGSIHRRRLIRGHRLAVHRDAAVRKHDLRQIRQGLPLLFRTGGCTVPGTPRQQGPCQGCR